MDPVRGVFRSSTRSFDVRPAPDDRQHPAAGGLPASFGLPRAHVEDEGMLLRAVEAIDRPARRDAGGIALAGEDDADRRAGQAGNRGSDAGRKPPLRRGEQERSKRDREPGQDDLRLRVAEPDVHLEQPRAVHRQHQPGVEEATERRAATGELLQDREVDRSNDPSGRRLVEIRERRIGAHTAGVRPAVAAEQPLVVACRWQGDRSAAVAGGDDARLRAGQPLLDNDAPIRPAPVEELVEDGRRRGDGVARCIEDGHALAGRKAIVLHDEPLAGRRDRPDRPLRFGPRIAHDRRGHRDARRRRDLVAPGLGGLDRGGCLRGTEHRDTGRGQGIGDTRGERSLGADDDELRRTGPREPDEPGRVVRPNVRDPDPRLARDRGAARSNDHLVHPGLGGELPGQRVFAPTAAHDDDARRHHERHAGTGRRRTGRQARSIVWVRSGPTETRTIGTRAWSSSAVT